MNKKLNAIHRLLVRLASRPAAPCLPDPRHWADVPPHHPDCATCR